MQQRKDVLYDNTLQLKQYTNRLTEENHRIKARGQQMEEEISRRNKIINGLMLKISKSPGVQQMQPIQREVTNQYNKNRLT